MNTTDLSAYDNSWYDPGGGIVKRTLWYVINHLVFNHGLLPFSGLKTSILRIFGAKVGRGAHIKPSVNIKYPWLLEMGDYVWIGEKVWIDNLVHTKIGSHVCLSQGAMLLTGNHNYKNVKFDLMTGKIVIEDGVWIGAKAIVCPGVTCHDHSLLSVNSVAVGDLVSHGIYQGNPAVLIRERKLA